MSNETGNQDDGYAELLEMYNESQHRLKNISCELEKMQSELSKERDHRRKLHLVNFGTDHTSSDDDKNDKDKNKTKPKSYNHYNDVEMNMLNIVRIPQPDEKPIFYLTYSSLKDEYDSSCEDFMKICWSSLTHKISNLYMQMDPNQAKNYLSRNDSCPLHKDGVATWRFNLADVPTWKRIQVLIRGKIWSGTNVLITLSGYRDDEAESPIVIKNMVLNSLNVVERKKLSEQESNLELLELRVVLNGNWGGSHNYPQLFSEWRSSPRETMHAFSFEIY